jgi:hypothetical protein
MKNAEPATPPSDAPSGDDHLVYAMPQKKSAYRRWYAAQHPNVQMVLSQLWMPVFMLIMLATTASATCRTRPDQWCSHFYARLH